MGLSRQQCSRKLAQAKTKFLAALNGPKYDIEADKLFWFAYNDAKETYELHIR